MHSPDAKTISALELLRSFELLYVKVTAFDDRFLITRMGMPVRLLVMSFTVSGDDILRAIIVSNPQFKVLVVTVDSVCQSLCVRYFMSVMALSLMSIEPSATNPEWRGLFVPMLEDDLILLSPAGNE